MKSIMSSPTVSALHSRSHDDNDLVKFEVVCLSMMSWADVKRIWRCLPRQESLLLSENMPWRLGFFKNFSGNRKSAQ